jgi:hypothetical protein
MVDRLLGGKNVLLGVTGGIAAYKSADLCSKLVQAGARVDVVMTEAATHFVTPLTFSAWTAPVWTCGHQAAADCTDGRGLGSCDRRPHANTLASGPGLADL